MKISHFPEWGMLLKELPSSSSSSFSFVGLTVVITTISFLLFSSYVPIGYAQQEQQQQFTNQPSAIQNDTTTREALSPENSFRVQIPP
ncbi:MAG: hypothetical protein M3270_02000, partial [Thermoproteota archaeon]|nr:hypothetical protein [Thermoproteota archaeon]